MQKLIHICSCYQNCYCRETGKSVTTGSCRWQLPGGGSGSASWRSSSSRPRWARRWKGQTRRRLQTCPSARSRSPAGSGKRPSGSQCGRRIATDQPAGTPQLWRMSPCVGQANWSVSWISCTSIHWGVGSMVRPYGNSRQNKSIWTSEEVMQYIEAVHGYFSKQVAHIIGLLT